MIRDYVKKVGMARILLMMVGNVFLGMGIGIFKLSGLGNDPFSGMVMILSERAGMPYANFLVLVNIGLFLVEFFAGRKLVGVGTFFNAILVGYFATFFYESFRSWFGQPEAMAYRVITVCIGVVVCSFGVSLYQTPDVGVAPYDSISLIMVERWPKITYFWHRIVTDGFCALVCFLAGGIVGLGTLVSAFGLGPFIHFFNVSFAEPLLRRISEGREDAAGH